MLVAPALMRSGRPSRSQRVSGWLVAARASLTRVRSGLAVFRRPRLGLIATAAQLLAWALQLLACVVLLEALGLDEHGAGIGAAAAVLFAVNVTAVLPLTPSNLGVFQAACVAVLTSGYGIGAAAGARLRDHPAGGRGRDRRGHGRAGAGQGGRLLARGAPARAALDSRLPRWAAAVDFAL